MNVTIREETSPPFSKKLQREMTRKRISFSLRTLMIVSVLGGVVIGQIGPLVVDAWTASQNAT